MAAPFSRRGFFEALPIRSRIMLMGFIFFIFAPASILLISPFKYDRSVLCLTTYSLMGGLTAIGYAYSFLHDYRVLAAVVPAQALWFIIPHWFPQDFRAGFTPSMHGALLVAMMALAGCTTAETDTTTGGMIGAGVGAFAPTTFSTMT